MSKLDLLGWEAQTTLKTGDHEFKIRSTSKAFNTWLGQILKPYKVRKPSAPVSYSVVIAGGDPDEDAKSKRRFHILYRGSSQVVRTLDLADLGQALFAELESTLFEDRDDAVYVEAAPLAMDGKLVLFPGTYLPTLWKLSRRLHQAGVRLPLTRTVAIDKASGDIIPTVPKLQIPEDAIERLTAAVGSEAGAILSVAGGKNADNGHLERWALKQPARAVAVLTTGADDGPMQPQSRGQAVYRLAGLTMNLPKIGVTALESLSLMAENAGCYMMYGASGTPQQRTRILEDITSAFAG